MRHLSSVRVWYASGTRLVRISGFRVPGFSGTRGTRWNVLVRTEQFADAPLGAATSDGEGAACRIRPTSPRFSSVIIHGPRAAGDGAAVRARAGYVGGHLATTSALTLAGVGQCSLAYGHGRQTGRPQSTGSSARVATGGPGDAQWGRAEPVLPLADRRRHLTPSGPGGSATLPACAPSAGPAQ